jgi:hypothetical protein
VLKGAELLAVIPQGKNDAAFVLEGKARWLIDEYFNGEPRSICTRW